MNFYTKKVLSIIEKDLSEVPSLEDISSRLGVSRYMLSRQFKSDTGESFSQYVKRRKISEASKEIASTNRRILDVAMDFGYSSQEAFQRTFKDLHKETPKRFKFHQSQLLKRSGLEIEPIKEIDWEVVDYCGAKLNVIGREFSYAEFNEISKFWEKFHIKYGSLERGTFGLSLPSKNEDIETFYYLIGSYEEHEIEDSIRIEVPKRKYIRFTHVGKIENFMNTLNYIWGRWIFENKNYQIEGMDFEFYPERFDPLSDKSICYYYLPIVE